MNIIDHMAAAPGPLAAVLASALSPSACQLAAALGPLACSSCNALPVKLSLPNLILNNILMKNKSCTKLIGGGEGTKIVLKDRPEG